MIDTCIASPLADSYIAAAQEDGGAARVRASGKVSKYGELAEEQGHTFTAWCMETYGTWGHDMRAMFREMSELVAERGRVMGDRHAAARFATEWQQRFSVVLQKGNADAIIQRAMRDRVASGRSFGSWRPAHLFYDAP